MANQSLYEAQEDGLRGSYPFDKLATKLGLPTNCDIDLRKQDELEVFDVYGVCSQNYCLDQRCQTCSQAARTCLLKGSIQPTGLLCKVQFSLKCTC